MKINIQKFFLVFFVFSITLTQCTCGNKKNNAPKIDSSKVGLQFYRFDKDFQQEGTKNTKNRMLALRAKYNTFYDVYVYDLMRFANAYDTTDRVYANINSFFEFKDMNQLYNLVQKAYPTTEVNDEEIRKAYAYSKIYLPRMKMPTKIVYCMSGLNVGAFTVDTDFVGIGLDMYLNNDTLYNQVFPNYIAAKLRKEMMCQNVMKALYNNQYGDPYIATGALINCIIQVGKQQYYLEKVLPHIAEEYRFGYSYKQLKWCEDNEKQIWKYMADNDLFYNESEAEIRHFIGEQANTHGMPPESPGNVGAWIGYRIVSAYMEQSNNKPTLDELIQTDSKTILAKSKYKP